MVDMVDMADIVDDWLNGGPSGWAYHNAVCEKQVGRFQIAVHHAVIVCHLEGPGDLQSHRNRFMRSKTPPRT